MKSQIDSDVQGFILSLEEKTIAKVARAVDLLEQFGHQIGMPHSKKVAKDLFELRVRGQQEVRIFYTFRHNTAILLHGFVKKSQQTPAKEIVQAQEKLKRIP